MRCLSMGRKVGFDPTNTGSSPVAATNFQLPDHLIGRIAVSEAAHIGSSPIWATNLRSPMFHDDKQVPNSLLEISAVNKVLSEHAELKNRVSVLEAALAAQSADLSSLRREVAAAFKQTGFSFAETSKAPVSRKR